MNTPENVVGNIYGKLEVLEELDTHITPNGSKQRIIRVKCSCGNIYTTRLSDAKKKQQCRNCSFKEKRADISGKRFGKLVVVSMADDYISPSGHRLAQCVCKCDCGKETIVPMSSLVTGSTKSCGCLHNTKGLLKDNKDLLKKYDFERNKNIDLSKLTARTSKKVWWKCDKCKNSWYATIASQNDKKKHGCPYCSGRLVIAGKTDFASQHPDLAMEYDMTLNKLSPSEISCFSSQKVWWKGKCGHKWMATIANRVGNNSGCPQCKSSNVSSFPEQAILFYLKKIFPDTRSADKEAIGKELDIYIPSLNVAIEYDGEAWHTGKKEQIDLLKNQLCHDNGICLIRIREGKLKDLGECINFHRYDATTDESLEKVILELFDYLKIHTKVNITKDTGAILKQFTAAKVANSLALCHPDIAAEWNYEKNGSLTPNQVARASRRIVWWKGKCGHEWDMSVSDRTLTFTRANGKTKKPYGCPYCSGKRVLKGFNDLESLYPNLAKDWHTTLNGDLKPSEIQAHSNRKIWWKGLCGHEWTASINKRIQNNQCPICYKQKRSPAVFCIEMNKTFQNAQEAATYLGKSHSSLIYKCCRGDSNTAYGYHWKYL
ncbi:zinc-ribbon domain-containing protein [Butyrivibrio sp. LB2008]|uniref:zinc-ribbon domain-containing protein n=1 Tax=Butyrivibrio sp. LB2008 TaxID=1408305 RepID=UPI00056C8D87|nr:zinc-ribbon domain-containing protein [Butyrivibrio sp. LB2008]